MCYLIFKQDCKPRDQKNNFIHNYFYTKEDLKHLDLQTSLVLCLNCHVQMILIWREILHFRELEIHRRLEVTGNHCIQRRWWSPGRISFQCSFQKIRTMMFGGQLSQESNFIPLRKFLTIFQSQQTIELWEDVLLNIKNIGQLHLPF